MYSSESSKMMEHEDELVLADAPKAMNMLREPYREGAV
jgi:hypothetical protein